MLHACLAKVDERIIGVDDRESDELRYEGMKRLEESAVEIARWALQRDELAAQRADKLSRILDIVDPDQ